MQITLTKFRVVNFRSINDSGWIETYDNSCLIGTNESGKTNLLLGLWKLNPANDEAIVPLIDYPRKKYIEYPKTKGNEVFVSGEYALDAEAEKKVKAILKTTIDIKIIIVHRKYNGQFTLEFPTIPEDKLKKIQAAADTKKVIALLPKFVYYSDYGNLDSEIYLPHVISNFKRIDLGERERAKVRSLRVLFDFVQLSPEEILNLGKEKKEKHTTITVKLNSYNNEVSRDTKTKDVGPTEEEIVEEREKKKEREILLQSASTKLTKEFKAWWKQGDYRFRFQADGNHFRIWVSDDQRPEEVELEGRSKGLQWFFSFFLVFLVESKDMHSNCILLLDEPGLSLHPVAQFDLIKFFASLADKNQIVYTTHSPFLVNADNLANVKAVYVDDNGTSSVSSDLRKNSVVADRSIYPVHAAIGLTISDTLLLGCQPILVEGPSDQIYLQAMKTHLLSLGKYRNNKEMVFIPTGGVRGMTAVINIITGRENDLPYAILDSDKPGKEKAVNLKSNLYKQQQSKIIEVESILNKTGEWEIEDLMPYEELAKVFSKKFRGKSDDFDYIVNKDEPIVLQMERFALENGIKLELGWKVVIATEFFNAFQHISKRITDEHLKVWEQLFTKLTEKVGVAVLTRKIEESDIVKG